MAFGFSDEQSIPRLGTSVRAVLALSLMTGFAIIIAAAALILDLRQRELAHAKKTIAGLSGILSDQTTRTFDSVVMTMKVAGERLLDDLDNRLKLGDPFVHQLLRARAAGLPQVKSIFLISKDGLGINSSRPDFIRNLSVVDRQLFRHHVDGGPGEVFISRAEQARVDGQWTYYVSIPLRDADGNFHGVLGAAIRIDYFEALYDSIALNAVSQILLLNRHGARLAGTPLDNTRYGTIEVNQAMIERIEASPSGDAVEIVAESRGEQRFVAYRNVLNYPLYLGVAVSEADALAPWRHTAWAIATGIALVLIVIAATTTGMVYGLQRKETLKIRLKEQDNQIRHIIQSVRDAIITADAAKRITFVNSSAERLFGISAASAAGTPLEDVLCQALHDQQCSYLRRQLERGWQAPTSFARLTNIRLRRNEREIPVEISLSTVSFQGGILLTIIFRDLSESQRAERELLETNRQLKELSALQQNVREEERTCIARELHDELGQLLTGIRMEIAWLGSRLPSEPPTLAGKVVSIKGQIDQTIATVRRISSELRPLVLDDLGLSAAAAWYANQFSERTGLQIQLDLAQDNPRKGGAVATALFRVLQESLTNIARHAEATSADVHLLRDDQEWTLYVTDNGKGFVYDPGRRSSLGLIGMRERIETLGGTFTVATAPDAGTRIAATVPLERSREEERK